MDTDRLGHAKSTRYGGLSAAGGARLASRTARHGQLCLNSAVRLGVTACKPKLRRRVAPASEPIRPDSAKENGPLAKN